MLRIHSLGFQLDVIKYCQNEIKKLSAAHKSIPSHLLPIGGGTEALQRSGSNADTLTYST